MRYKLTRIERVVGFALLFLLIFIILVNLYVRIFSRQYIYSNIEDVPDARVALVLGAAVYTNGVLTPVLHDRAVTALELYNQGKVTKILISGDNSQLSHNEVVPVSNFLIKAGVKEEDIFLDYAGFDTYDSMYRARDVFKVNSVIVITQRFHLPRSIYIARKLNLEAYGFSADKREYYLKNELREYGAVVKAFGNVVLDSKPRFLGEKVPIWNDRGNVPQVPATTTEIQAE
jgi:SanA protein